MRTFRIGLFGLALAVVLATAAAHGVEARAIAFKIGAQPVDYALKEFAGQSGLQVLFHVEGAAIPAGLKSPSIDGVFTPEEALEQLLANTGLRYEFINPRTVTIRATRDKMTSSVDRAADVAFNLRVAQTASPADQESRTSIKSAVTGAPQPEASAEITVTGSHIRGSGISPSSPMLTITAEQMHLSGHTNLGEAMRALPQNFNGGQNPEITSPNAAGGSEANLNLTGSSAFNLRGLGPDATLTLLNGTRLPYDGVSQGVDVSTIPIAAIDRIEVLLDGASAIYGSDAIGGVANIILKRDYQGAELSARYGAATDGGYRQNQYTGTGGIGWNSGGFLTTVDFSDNTAVIAGDRGYFSRIPNRNVMIVPESRQKSALFSIHQGFSDSSEIILDAFYTRRSTYQLGQTSARFTNDGDGEIWGASPALQFKLPHQWSLRLHGFTGRDEFSRDSRNFSIVTGNQTSRSYLDFVNTSKEAGVESDGPVVALPGGDVRISVGGGYRTNDFEQHDLITGLPSVDGSSRSRYGFAEINVPLISQQQNVPGIERLSFNGAVRYENYGSGDFGDVTTPKVGVVWGLTPALEFKGGWGKSFKVPTLTQRFASYAAVIYPAASFVTPAAPGTGVIVPSGGNRNLGPERAETITAGFAFRPDSLAGFSFEAGFFHIDYTDRVVTPIDSLFQALSNPAFSEFVTVNPSPAVQTALIAGANPFFNISGAAYNPANIIALVDNRSVNASKQRAEGFDILTSYSTSLMGGRTAFSANVSWLSGHRNVTPLAPEQSTAGVIYFPAKLRGRGGFSWSRGGFTLASYLNYVDAVKNTNISPNPAGASMSTLDMVINQDIEMAAFPDLSFTLAATNLFNRNPPFLPQTQLYSPTYDPTNYSAIGRVVSATLSVKF